MAEKSTGEEDATTGGPPEASEFRPPLSAGEIKAGISKRFERIKKEGPEPIRKAAIGLIDKVFDAIDSGFDRWFGDKK